MMVLEEIVNKFVEHPSQVTNGAPSLAKRWGVDLDLVYQARAIAKDILKNKEEFGTECNPEDVSFKVNSFGDIPIPGYTEINLGNNTNTAKELFKEDSAKLVKKWGSEGNWKYSYQYDDKEETTIDFEGIIKRVFENSNIEPEFLPKVELTTNYQLNVYLADQHIGAAVEHGLYSNYFDKHVYKDRMNKVFIEIAKIGIFKTII